MEGFVSTPSTLFWLVETNPGIGRLGAATSFFAGSLISPILSRLLNKLFTSIGALATGAAMAAAATELSLDGTFSLEVDDTAGIPAAAVGTIDHIYNNG